jgi:hypothetical protein
MRRFLVLNLIRLETALVPLGRFTCLRTQLLLRLRMRSHTVTQTVSLRRLGIAQAGGLGPSPQTNSLRYAVGYTKQCLLSS